EYDPYDLDDEADDAYDLDDEAYYTDDEYYADDVYDDEYYADDAYYFEDESVDDGYYADDVVTDVPEGADNLTGQVAAATAASAVAARPGTTEKADERKTFEHGDIGQEAKDLIEKMDNLEVVKNYKKMNVILYGETEQGLNRFAEEYARSRGAYVNRKVARVDAEKLSRINIRKLYEKFQNTFLLVRNVPAMAEETYNDFIKYNKENKNTVFLFLVKYGENISTFHNHLFKKMVGVEESLPYAENDVLSYAVLYAALRGYRFSEAAVEELYQCERCRCNDEDPEFDPYDFMEQVVRAAIIKQRHYNEENILTNLVTGRYHNDESVIGKHSTVEAVWQCMGETK
ncbi:MAG: hypothetical protein Q4P30_04200, partial [Eubacteriales bacterium]|nr:hypothetical protein [Eubacteriales bacterium]